MVISVVFIVFEAWNLFPSKIKESFFKYNFHIIEENNANYFEICNKKILLVQDQENSLKELDYANVNEKHVSYIEGRVTALSYTPILQIFIFAVDDDVRHSLSFLSWVC